jgi:RHS repeat-associated protein
MTGTYAYVSGTHHLTGVGTTSRVVDARGNTKSDVLASGAYGYGYNQRNRLAVVQKDGTTVGTYVVNALGQRIQKTAGGIATSFDYSEDSQLIGDASGSTTRDYVWLGGIPVALVDGNGTASTISFVIADGLGTPRAVVDAAGATKWQWAYSSNPFGENAPRSSSGYVLNLRYPGQYADAESGLVQNGNREYEPATGRYVQSDPTGLAGGPSTYGYAAGQPLQRIDRFGLKYAEAYGAGGAVIGGAIVWICGAAGTVATGGANAPFVPAEAYGVSVLGAGIGYGLGWVADGIMGSHGQEASSSNPIQGNPGDTSWTTYPDGSPKQGRTYGDDGYPDTDIDYGHDHNGVGDPHAHDWDRPADGSAPGHPNRGPARPPTEDEVNKTP